MRCVLAVSIVFALFACSKKSDAPQPAPAAASEPGTASGSAPAAASGGEAKVVEPSTDVRGLVGALENEAANRPATGIKVEQVFDALDKAGLTITRRKQHLGKTVHASYCAGGRIQDGMPVNVCEYADAKQANESLAFINMQYGKAVPNAKRVLKGSTIFTIVPADPEKQRDLVDRATSTFMSL